MRDAISTPPNINQTSSNLEGLFDNLPVGIFRIRISGTMDARLEFMNRTGLMIAGLNAAVVPVELPKVADWVPEWERESLFSGFWAAVESGKVFLWNGEMRSPVGLKYLRVWANCRSEVDGSTLVDGIIIDATGERLADERKSALLRKVKDIADDLAGFSELYEGTVNRRPGLEILSDREREVAELILAGLPNRDIASRLFISESTVKKHVNAIFRKIEIHGRNDLFMIERMS